MLCTTYAQLKYCLWYLVLFVYYYVNTTRDSTDTNKAAARKVVVTIERLLFAERKKYSCFWKDLHYVKGCTST